jgi:hypothetical protein
MQSLAEPSLEKRVGKNWDHQQTISSSMSGDGASIKMSRRDILTKNVLADQILVGWRKLKISHRRKSTSRPPRLS